jgi:hypothetical protein
MRRPSTRRARGGRTAARSGQRVIAWLPSGFELHGLHHHSDDRRRANHRAGARAIHSVLVGASRAAATRPGACEFRDAKSPPHSCTLGAVKSRFACGATVAVEDVRRFYGRFHSAAETVPRTVLPGRELRARNRHGDRERGAGGGGDHTPPPCGSCTVGSCGHHPRLFGGGLSVGGAELAELQQLISQQKTEGDGQGVCVSAKAPGSRDAEGDAKRRVDSWV